MVEALKANGSVDLVRHEAILAAESERRSPEIPKETLPDWWQRALDLEVRGQLVDAEQLIQSNVPHLGCAASIAEMYRLRMNRLKEAGTETSAVEAFHKADYWIWNYASMATSGGEGAALSLQRDRFRTQLVAELGYDPKPVE